MMSMHALFFSLVHFLDFMPIQVHLATVFVYCTDDGSCIAAETFILLLVYLSEIRQ